jgi:hypothetical protein
MQATTKKILTATTAVIASLALATTAFAIHDSEHYALDGNASYVTPGLNGSDRAVLLVSDMATSTFYGAIDIAVEEGTTFADLTTLSSDYQLGSDDSCVGGSPRYQLNLEDPNSADTGNIFIYFGVDSAGAPCIAGTTQNTGDVLQTGRLLDTSQLDGGTFYDPYDAALARYADYVVTGIQVVADSGWAALDGELSVVIDNTLVNSTLFTYEIPEPEVPTDKEACKNGGWQTLADDEGNLFTNQGQCVSFVENNSKNR